MRAEIEWYADLWSSIKNAALFTIHKKNGRYPTSSWKKQMLLAEHTPIRIGKFIINLFDIPQFVSGHLVRHSIGFTPFAASLRSDRWETDEVPDRNTLTELQFDGNFQSLINVSRKRLCSNVSIETREAWQLVKDEVSKLEPELASVMVPECIYRGFCPDPNSCGYANTEDYKKKLEEYRRVE